jgi:hypothetical protein
MRHTQVVLTCACALAPVRLSMSHATVCTGKDQVGRIRHVITPELEYLRLTFEVLQFPCLTCLPLRSKFRFRTLDYAKCGDMPYSEKLHTMRIWF